ncbi:MAG: ATP-dependent DNA helicase RecG [Lachnospiraceae bacterium]|jgi:ATP-dependent DNA helicase RecG|nr:ATP-dependent DNA helicase RecG [Lachnospiraceae bacterium]
MKLTDPIDKIKGIGEKSKKLFEKLNIFTVSDLLLYFPRNYDIYEEPISIEDIEEGKTVAIKGKIAGKIQVSGNFRMQITKINFRDKTGSIEVVWYNSPYIKTTLYKASEIILRGTVINKAGHLRLEHPEIFNPWEKYRDKLATLQPRYGLTSGLTNNLVIKSIHQALEQVIDLKSLLPDFIEDRYSLQSFNKAIPEIHFPHNKEQVIYSRDRLVFEEFLEFIISLRKLKSEENIKSEFVLDRGVQKKVSELIKRLPFELTKAQGNTIIDCFTDMVSGKVMNRLIQGDVGSGKTIIAVMLLFAVVLSGYQGALMAPTEVLARQHYNSISNLISTLGISDISVELLLGSTTAKEKREIRERIVSGKSGIIIGTTALISEKVEYKNLALVITDEQHRFGVNQREKLMDKGRLPHAIVMSATPIPRTLAMILYGDLDISVVDEKPANRLPIKNAVVDISYRPKAYSFIKSEIEKKHQAFVICPMVEESEKLDAENVIDYSKNLQMILGDNVRVAYLHGRMKAKEKDEIMSKFANGEYDILVSTTVIEVGIDIPNATVMLIENADRYGLAALHQLRGRVGRGDTESYCIFMSGNKKKEVRERLNILGNSNDGFYIAEEDLKLRGPGDFFGIRQSGEMEFKLADVFQDSKILEMANEAYSLMIKPENFDKCKEYFNSVFEKELKLTL